VAAVADGRPVDVDPGLVRSPIALADLVATVRAVVVGGCDGVLHAGGPRTSVAEFFRAALAALGHDTSLLRDRRSNAAQRDTSIISARLQRELGIRPRGVGEALMPAEEAMHR
jgi:dTDP-4-dehydrorhamnose reductase